MRATLWAIGLFAVGVALTACDPGGIKAPYLPEPVSGTALDRCLVRVRMTEPWYAPGSTSQMNSGTDEGIHADYRVNAGGSIPVDNYALVADAEADYHKFAPFVFAATLVPGANHLEVGSCDGVDTCQWTPADLTVTLAPGAPDPVFGAGGQTVVSGYDAGFHFLPLADGRSLVSVETVVAGSPQIGIVRLLKGGAVDPRFGKRGFSAIGQFSGEPFIAPIPTGGFVVLVRGMREVYGKTWFARLDAGGNLDMGIGTMGLAPITLPGVGPFIDVQAFAADGSGHYTAAGIAADAAHANGAAPLAFQIGTDGSILASHVLASGDPALQIIGAAVDVEGHAAVLASDRVYKGNASGPDAVFGTGGVVMLPQRVFGAAVALTATGVAVAQTRSMNGAIGVTVFEMTATGAITSIDLPWGASMMPGTPLRIAAAPNDTLYVASTIPHPADDALSFTTDMTPGTDLALARVRNGAFDTTFGSAGIAHASFMLSWSPPAIDTLLDTPTELSVGADGAPYLVGATGSASMAQLLDTKRGPGVGIVRFLP